MSSSIWTRCAGASEIRPLRVTAWRVVEAQHLVSTRKLVDSAEEQALLEELIDRAKPPEPTNGRLHYLLFTPFRYPPLKHGSRFATRFERGVWYGSESRRTSFSEVAYYRLLFLEGSAADLDGITTPLTAFTAKLRSTHAIDLTMSPFDAHRRTIASRTRYSATQLLGAAMRAAGVEMFRYPSARDSQGGTNVGAFTPSVFAGTKPRAFETWYATAWRGGVELTHLTQGSFVFSRDEFIVDGMLPAPAL